MGFEDLDEKQRENLAKAMNSLLSNPEVSTDVKRLLMKADPKMKFADVAQADALDKARKETTDKISELEAKLMEEQAIRVREERHRQAREKGISPEDVEKVVTDYKVMDWDKAMQIAERLREMAPASAEPAFDAKPELPNEKELWADPRGYANKIAHQMIDQFGGRRTGRSN